MNAPREYYPVGYEKNFDDHFQSKVDLPETNFHCGDQKYFPGLYGDESLGCMVRFIYLFYWILFDSRARTSEKYILQSMKSERNMYCCFF